MSDEELSNIINDWRAYPRGNQVPRDYLDLARRVAEAERERCAKVAESHLERLPFYHANSERRLVDKVEEGYGNACVNIAAEIRKGAKP